MKFVFIVIVRKYKVISNKVEHKYSPNTLASVNCSVRIYARVFIQESTLVTGCIKIW